MPAYDPVARGRFRVGVQTVDAIDARRHRAFPCEIWYPAAAAHAGQDLAPGTQDHFTVPPTMSGAPKPRSARPRPRPRRDGIP